MSAPLIMGQPAGLARDVQGCPCAHCSSELLIPEPGMLVYARIWT